MEYVASYEVYTGCGVDAW